MLVCKLCGYTRSINDTAPEYECPKCGAIYAKVEAKLQREEQKKRQLAEQFEQESKKKLESQRQTELKNQELEKLNRAKNKVLIKTYVGKQDRAIRQFQKDAAKLATQFYFPTSQSFAPGSYGCLAYTISFLLCFCGIGFFLLGYMLIVKTAGTLTVTYEYRTE